MHFSLVLAALAVDVAFAQPAHQHAHKHRFGLRDLIHKRIDWSDPANYKNVDWTSGVSYDNNWSTLFGSAAPAATPSASPAGSEEKVALPASVAAKPTSAAAPAPAQSSTPASSSSPPSSGGSGQCIDISQVWTKGENTQQPGSCAADLGLAKAWTDASTATASKEKRDDPVADASVGNIGTPYGRNMVPLSDCNNQIQPYTIKFTNSYADGQDVDVALWNKVGSTGTPLSGGTNKAFFYFTLPAGKSAAFAFESNSQIAFSEVHTHGIDRNSYGAPQAIWGEANFNPPLPANPKSWDGMSSWDVSLMIGGNPGGVLSISADGHDTSSRSRCGFTSASQEATGCNTNQAHNSPIHLHAQFGVN